jgi:predicted glycosyltransferase involved in capsule biosynthesis
LISKKLWDDLGGYDVARTQCEDFDFFERAMGVGAVFHRLSEQTWVYRFHGGNKSRAPWAGVRS